MTVPLRLDEVSPGVVLRRIRQRARAGLAMSAREVRGEELFHLARFHFGGWYEAVEAAGIEPEGRPADGKRPASGRRRLRTLTDAMVRGPLRSAELERMTGVRADTIRALRRRRGIVRNERLKKDRSWLRVVHKRLGKEPDTELAKRAGVSPTLIAAERRARGIPAFAPKGRPPEGNAAPLHRTPRREILRRIRSRARSGQSMRASDVDKSRLRALANFHFGGWYEAVEAAGLVPEGSSRPPRKLVRPRRLHKLTQARAGLLSAVERPRPH